MGTDTPGYLWRPADPILTNTFLSMIQHDILHAFSRTAGYSINSGTPAIFHYTDNLCMFLKGVKAYGASPVATAAQELEAIFNRHKSIEVWM